MCFYKNTSNIYESGSEELSLEDIHKFVADIAIFRPLIHLGGGEPFMRKDILEIVSIFKRNKLKCLITTNGSLLNKQINDSLIDLGIDGLVFSLHGPADVHDGLVAKEGTAKGVMQDLEYLINKKNKNTKIFVSIVPLPENIAYIIGFIRQLRLLKIDGVKLEQLNFVTQNEYNSPVYDESDRGFDFTPAVFITKTGYLNHNFCDDLAALYKEIHRDYGDFVMIKPELRLSRLKDWYADFSTYSAKCIFSRHSVFINYNGDIIPCQFLTKCILGNIKQDSLFSVWSSQDYVRLRKEIDIAKLVNCRRCCKN